MNAKEARSNSRVGKKIGIIDNTSYRTGLGDGFLDCYEQVKPLVDAAWEVIQSFGCEMGVWVRDNEDLKRLSEALSRFRKQMGE